MNTWTAKKITNINELMLAAELEHSQFSDKLSAYTGSEGSVEDTFKDILKHENYGVFHNDTLIGHTRVNTTPSGGKLLDSIKEYSPNVAYIASTAVHPDYRSKGVAKALRSKLQNTYDSLITKSTKGLSDPHIDVLNAKTGFSAIENRGDSTIYFWESHR